MDRPSTSASVSFVVDDDSTALALGSGDVRVLGTPKVIALCEEAAVIACLPTLDEGQTTVGTEISVKHLAPSAVGTTVVATATLTSSNGRLREFSVEVSQDGTTVASGHHTRAVVNRQRFIDRISEQ